MSEVKVECYRKRMISKIKYFFKNLFRRDKRAHSLIYHQECRGATLPPLAGLRLDVASKIMQINDWRKKYE